MLFSHIAGSCASLPRTAANFILGCLGVSVWGTWHLLELPAIQCLSAGSMQHLCLSPHETVGCNPSPAERILNLPIHSPSQEDTGAHFPWTSVTWHAVCTMYGRTAVPWSAVIHMVQITLPYHEEWMSLFCQSTVLSVYNPKREKKKKSKQEIELLHPHVVSIHVSYAVGK